MSARYANCRRCDHQLVWDTFWKEWRHVENRSIYCPGKTVSIAQPEAQA